MDFDVVRRVLAALESHGARYAIFGAMALTMHGLVRATQDLDLFLDPDRDNIETFKRALSEAIGDPRIQEISADDLLGDYPAVEYNLPDGSFHIDILTRLGEAFQFADLEIERVPFDGLTVSVVSPRTLYNMKKATVRSKDRVDAAWLRDRFDLEDE